MFPTLHIERWAFDFEVLFLCSQQRVGVVETRVAWDSSAAARRYRSSAVASWL